MLTEITYRRSQYPSASPFSDTYLLIHRDTDQTCSFYALYLTLALLVTGSNTYSV